jgi:hypothetical protein
MLSLKRNSTEKLFSIFFFILLFLKIMESFVLKGHGDGVSYHLVLGKYILEHGFSYAHFKFYLSNLTGLFDYLYVIPQFFFGSGLLAHISSQFLHFACSILFAILIFSKVFERKTIFYATGVFLLSFDRSPDFFIYAKNDGFLALVFLIGVLLICGELKKLNFSNLSSHILLGTIAGLLPVIKMSGLIYSLALSGLYLIQLRPNLKKLIFFCFAGLLASSPIFIRNWIVIGNPVFPAFLELFPTKVTPEMMSFMNSWLKSSASVDGVLKNFIVAFTPKILGFLAIPLIWLNYKRDRAILNRVPILILLFTTCYCFINPGYPAERFYFGCHFVLIYFIFKSLEALEQEGGIKGAYWVFILLVMLADSKVDKVVKRVFHYYPDVVELGFGQDLLHKYAPYTKIWDFVEEGSLIVTDAAPMVYYSKKGVRMYQAGHSFEANFLWSCRKGDLDKYKTFDYALIGNSNWNDCTRKISKMEKRLVSAGGYTLFRINEP